MVYSSLSFQKLNAVKPCHIILLRSNLAIRDEYFEYLKSVVNSLRELLRELNVACEY
jgi:hypothetical protein